MEPLMNALNCSMSTSKQWAQAYACRIKYTTNEYIILGECVHGCCNRYLISDFSLLFSWAAAVNLHICYIVRWDFSKSISKQCQTIWKQFFPAIINTFCCFNSKMTHSLMVSIVRLFFIAHKITLSQAEVNLLRWLVIQWECIPCVTFLFT